MSKAEQPDKLTQVLDAVEHPERYSDEQLQELLRDEVCADYYRLMCDASNAYDETPEIDEAEVHAAWQRIAGQKPEKMTTFRKMVATLLAILALSGISYAAIQMIQNHQEEPVATSVSDDVKAIGQETEKQEAIADTIRTFQDAELQEILTEVTDHYKLRTEYRHDEARHIRFYVKWNKTEDVLPIIERLNMSEKVKIELADDLLIVE